jgi:predicted dehydrogenase
MTTRQERTVTAAIVGFGWWGRTLARVLTDSKALRIAAVVDPSSEGRDAARAAGLSTLESLERVVADPDIQAVIICSPHKFHCAQIELCAGAGKHVFCEKPLCTTGEEVRRAIGTVERAGVTLGIGHERRFEPAVCELRERVKRGELGMPLLIEGNFSQDKFLALPPDNWRFSAVEAPVGPLSATGIHLVDLSIAFLGRPVEVLARLATLATDFANGDTLAISLSFESGAIASLTAILTTPFAGRFALYGSTGWAEIRDRTHPEAPTGWDVTTVTRGGAAVVTFAQPAPMVRYNLEAFAQAITGGKPYPVTLAEIQANVDTFEAITRSALSGRPEPIRQQ